MNFQPLLTEETEIDPPSNFAFAVTRIAVAQICQSVGFTATQRSTLDILTEVAARYLRALAISAVSLAASSDRAHCNLNDVIGALEDLGSVHGFPGAWNVRQTLLASSTLTDLSKFVKYTEEIPFAKPIPRCPYSTENLVSPATSMLFLHVPRWLPVFPEMGRRGTNGKEAEEEVSSGNRSSGEEVNRGSFGGEKMRMGLPEKRARVRFKICLGVGRVGRDTNKWERGRGNGFIGADLMCGICKGGKGCHAKIGLIKRKNHKERKERMTTKTCAVAPPKDQYWIRSFNKNSQ